MIFERPQRKACNFSFFRREKESTRSDLSLPIIIIKKQKFKNSLQHAVLHYTVS